jgi:cytoskeleton protein RodZ
VETAAENVAARPLGRILADEREKQGLARAEVAQRLHMSAYQVEALENGDYGRLPKGTFLRGFVRNYAKLLSLDAAALLTHLADAAPRGPAPGIVVPSQNIRFDPLGERLSNPYVKAAAFAVVALGLAFAAIYWWLFIRPAPPAGVAKRPAAEQGPPQQIAASTQPAPEIVPPTPAPTMEAPADAPKAEPVRAEPPKSEPSRADKAKAESANAAERKAESANTAQNRAAAAANGAATLRLRFKGESWVEIRDAQGKVLLSRLNQRGTEAEVAGRPPLSVIVGNAPDVQVLYNEREFPLEPHTKVAVARFTVE